MLYSGTRKQEEQKEYNHVINNELGIVKCTKGQKILFIFLIIITLGLLYIYKIVKLNTLNKMQIKINESASNIDIQLQKRFDTLTKLVDAVKSQVKFDQETLENITALRSGVNNKQQINLNEKSSMISKISSGINMAFEAYPQLGADQSIRMMMTESTMIEKEIAASRRLYNSDVTAFNSVIYTFPTCVVLDKKGFHGVPLFVTSEEKRKDISLAF